MQNKITDVVVLPYSIGNKIYFISSTIISEGLLTVKDMDGSLMAQKILSNCNEDHITVSKNIKTVEISIISENINYRKTIKL